MGWGKYIQKTYATDVKSTYLLEEYNEYLFCLESESKRLNFKIDVLELSDHDFDD
jgi:hypothetical protein